MDPEFLLRALKMVVEVAGFAYMGQALVALFAGSRRDTNIVYQFFRILTRPVTTATRFVMPRFVPDRHIPFVGFGMLLWIWFFTLVALAKVLRGSLP